jgi:hypothetical protein
MDKIQQIIQMMKQAQSPKVPTPQPNDSATRKLKKLWG